MTSNKGYVVRQHRHHINDIKMKVTPSGCINAASTTSNKGYAVQLHRRRNTDIK